jgi:dipeptidyl-peptidase-4
VEQAADHGTPRRVSVARDGARVVFLRSTADGRADQLWVFDVGAGAERLVADSRDLTGARHITCYASDAATGAAVLVSGGRLHRADLLTGRVTPLATAGPASRPQLDPTGEFLGYLTGGSLRVRRLVGDRPRGRDDMLLAGEPDPADGGQPYVSWGRAGWWWAPDGRSVLAARVDARRPQVSLHLLDLDGGWVDVHWDRETYPGLVSASWSDHGGPVVAVLRRSQQHGLVLAVDPRTGETQVHAELADPRWVEPVPGTPRHLPDGRVLVGGELAHDGYDARCLFADGTLLTPSSLYVRRVVGRLPAATEILVEATGGEPSEQHLYRVDTSVSAAGIDVRRITTTAGWHRGEVGGDTLAVGSQSLDHPGTRWTVWRAGVQVGELGSLAPAPTAAPRPQLQRVTDRRLPAGVLYPGGHVLGRRLPVLLEAAGLSQGVRAVREPWLARQWWAGEGFAVVVVDHRGTPGVAPSFEKVVHRRLADVALADLVEALLALAGKHTDLDLDRLAVTGRGIGGWLAALAALRRPEVFRCAIAEAPLVDWSHADLTFAERYLGPAADAPEVYQHHSLLAAAAEPPGSDPRCPLLLVPDAATQRPVRRLAGVMRTSGRPHQVLPGGDGAARLRRAELDFLRRHLS